MQKKKETKQRLRIEKLGSSPRVLIEGLQCLSVTPSMGFGVRSNAHSEAVNTSAKGSVSSVSLGALSCGPIDPLKTTFTQGLTPMAQTL